MVDVSKAKLDPTSVFKSPHEVLEDTSLTSQEKIDILQQWALDEAELLVAEEENMGADSDGSAVFDKILHCLHQLGQGISTRKTLLNKHGDILVTKNKKDEA